MAPPPHSLECMHQSSAPCSIHWQLVGSSILKVTRVNFPVSLSERGKEEWGKEEWGGSAIWRMMEREIDAGGVIEKWLARKLLPERTAYRKNNGVEVECSCDRGEVGGRRLAEEKRDRRAVLLGRGHALWLRWIWVGQQAYQIADRRRHVWKTTAVVGLPYINIDWANGKWNIH